MGKYVTGKRYLFKYSSNKTLYELEFISITSLSYNVKWYRGDGTSYCEWIMKSEFDYKYTYHEEITPNPNKNEFKGFDFNDLIKPCPACNGEGIVPDDSSSSGMKICPKCFGTKQVINLFNK